MQQLKLSYGLTFVTAAVKQTTQTFCNSYKCINLSQHNLMNSNKTAEADQSPPPSAEGENEWSYTSTPLTSCHDTGTASPSHKSIQLVGGNFLKKGSLADTK
jgi:hypothetical protein